VAFVYKTTIDPHAKNNSHAYMLGMIGHNKVVLEIGCATGYFSEALVNQGCKVVGIELDPKAAAIAEEWLTRVIVGDVDDKNTWNNVEDESFDVVVFGDVLEHLRNPTDVLKTAVLKLKPSGFMVTSLPNIAHGDVRLSLFHGIFRYNETGLLDKTHVRFFTLESARDLLRDAGLAVIATKRVSVPLFQTEIDVTMEEADRVLLDQMILDPEIETYQFVMQAIRDDGATALGEHSRFVNEFSDSIHHRAQWSFQEQHKAELKRLMDQLQNQSEHSRNQGDHLQRHATHIKALEGHVEGLEHNISVLTEALQVSQAQLRAVLHTRSVRLMTPIRWLGGIFGRRGSKS
jgi:2-polyprenyl-3-methyl-5-hydroxy-6-metoxy-1,4-benzoquinol methylase